MLKPIVFGITTGVAGLGWAVSAYGNQFVVYVPNLPPERVSQVRTIVPDGFYSTIDGGQRVFQVGRYNQLPLAQKRAQELRQAGFPAQVRTVPPKVATAPVTPYPTTPVPPPPPLPGVPPAVETPPQPIEVSRAPQPISTLPPAPPVVQTPPPPTPVVDAPAPEDHRYVVIIPGNSPQDLQRVRTIAPQARVRSSQRGPYIEVQAYPDRASAETMSATIRGQGFDARVAYF